MLVFLSTLVIMEDIVILFNVVACRCWQRLRILVIQDDESAACGRLSTPQEESRVPRPIVVRLVKDEAQLQLADYIGDTEHVAELEQAGDELVAGIELNVLALSSCFSHAGHGEVIGSCSYEKETSLLDDNGKTMVGAFVVGWVPNSN